jgi:transcriptional regulator with XRE-family HTH domain
MPGPKLTPAQVAETRRTPDFLVTVTLKNNQLVSRRRAKGKTQVEIAGEMGISATKYAEMERIERSAVIRGTGQWTDDARRVAAYHGVEPAVLWPDLVRKVLARRRVMECTAREVIALASVGEATRVADSPFGMLATKEAIDRVRAAVETVRPRDRDILRRYYGLPPYDEPQTIEEIRVAYRLSRGRILNLLKRAESAVREDLTRLDRIASFRVASRRMEITGCPARS